MDGAASFSGKQAVNDKQTTSKRTILIVDDDRLILATLRTGLRHAGFEVLQAESGEEGLRIAIESHPDLAVLDVRMPGMSGMELARRLREETDVPFMFFSAYGDIDVARQAAEHGAVGYLVKPIDTSQILPSIEAALARAAEIKALRQSEANLTAALAAGRETNIATGLVMERYRLSREKAFETLRDYARSHRRKLSDVAADLIKAEETLNLAQLDLQSAPPQHKT
jgi:two-component system, response regulator PdtaR